VRVLTFGLSPVIRLGVRNPRKNKERPPSPLTKERSSVGCAQAPHRLASRWCPFFNPLFKWSQLHCLDICLTWYLWHVKVWWQCLHRQSTPRYATIPGPILFKRSRLYCLHVCWRVVCDIYKFDDGTHLQGLNTTQVRHHTHSDLLTCCVCFVKHMMMMRQYFPRLWFDPYPIARVV